MVATVSSFSTTPNDRSPSLVNLAIRTTTRLSARRGGRGGYAAAGHGRAGQGSGAAGGARPDAVSHVQRAAGGPAGGHALLPVQHGHDRADVLGPAGPGAVGEPVAGLGDQQQLRVTLVLEGTPWTSLWSHDAQSPMILSKN